MMSFLGKPSREQTTAEEADDDTSYSTSEVISDGTANGWMIGLGWLKEALVILATVVIVSFVIKTFLFKTFFIPSGSMENTLEVQDRVVASIVDANTSPIQRGDIVVFADTQGWLPPVEKVEEDSAVASALIYTGILPDNSSRHMVKRVIGVAGDTVECCDSDGRVTVNGVPLDETYLNDASSSPLPGSSLPFTITVPEGGIWVMGDNRNYSADSRMHMNLPSKGVVRTEDVVGTVSLRPWPLDRFGWIEPADEVFKNVK